MKQLLYCTFVLFFLACNAGPQGDLPAEAISETSVGADFPLSDSEEAFRDKEMTQQAIQERNIVGFHCFIGGTEPQTVEAFRKLLSAKDYSAVRQKLFSSLPAEQYLATVVCERLFQMRLLELTVRETSRIAEIVHSEKEISVCSGCMTMGGITLKDLFGKEYESLRLETEEWLQELIK